MIAPLRLLSVTAAALVAVSPAPVDAVAFHAEEGASVTRTFDFELEMSLDSMAMTVNDQEVPPDHFEGTEMDLGETEHVVVTDVYGAPLDGRPASVVRTFEELTGESTEAFAGPGGEQEGSKDKSSDLEGTVVVFTWDAEAEEYVAEYEEGGDEDLLADLEEDMDLRGFLPDGDVDEGDAWEADIEPFRRVLEWGGDLHLASDDEVRTEVDEELSENLDGEVRVTYAGTRTEDGVEVAVLEIEVSAESSGEGTEETPTGDEAVTSVTMEFELEGELTWNLAAGHLHGLELAGPLEAVMENRSEFDGGGGPMEMVQQMEFSGRVSFAISVEAE